MMNIHALSGGLMPAPMSTGCWWFSLRHHTVTSAPWFVGNNYIHDDLGFPFFADHIRALIRTFDWNVAHTGNRLFRQVLRYLWGRGLTKCAWGVSYRRVEVGRAVEASHGKTAKSTQLCSVIFSDIQRGFLWLSSVFSKFQSIIWRRGTAHNPLPPPPAMEASLK